MYPQKPKNNFNATDFSAYCPLCEEKYNPFRARVIESKDGSHLLHSQCGQCGAYIISLVIGTPFGLNSVGVITDLTAADILKFKNERKIDYDDVIEFHRSLVAVVHDSPRT